MICWLNTAGNDVQHGTQDLYFQYGMYVAKNTGSHGFYVSHNNFRRVLGYYTSKTLIKSFWVCTNNEYIAPTPHSRRIISKK